MEIRAWIRIGIGTRNLDWNLDWILEVGLKLETLNLDWNLGRGPSTITKISSPARLSSPWCHHLGIMTGVDMSSPGYRDLGVITLADLTTCVSSHVYHHLGVITRESSPEEAQCRVSSPGGCITARCKFANLGAQWRCLL